MNPARQVYDYSTSGIDGFLSRSIDAVQWENTLDAHLNTLSNTPQATTQQNYDQTQVTGSLGNTLQVGNVNIANNAITLDNNGVPQMIIGNSTDGF